MLMSVAVLLWLDLFVLLAKIGVDGLKDTIILPNFLYLVDRKSMLIFFAVENLSFQLTFPMLNNIVDNIHADSIPLHSDYLYQGSEAVEVLGILGIDVLQYIKPYSHEELCVHSKRANFIKLPNGYIPFGSAELFLYPGESKFLRQRPLEKFVLWEDGSSFTVEVKNKKRRKVKRTADSDAVTNEDVHVKNGKENLGDVMRQNLEFKPPQ